MIIIPQKGEELPSSRFDSNCITPGTKFMVRLHKHLKYFVRKKISTDPSWHGVEVILSGQDVSVIVSCDRQVTGLEWSCDIHIKSCDIDGT